MESIADKLTLIKNSFEAIKTALVNKGQTPEGNITTYASAIDSIKVGSDIKSLCEKTLKKVEVPEDTTIIKDYAFSNTENIIVTINKDVEIEPFAFSGSSGTVSTPNGVWDIGVRKTICEQVDEKAISYNLDDGTTIYLLANSVYEASAQSNYITNTYNGHVVTYSYYVSGATLLYFARLEDGSFYVSTLNDLERQYSYEILCSFEMDWESITVKLSGGEVTQVSSTAALSEGDILYFNGKLVEDTVISPTTVTEGTTVISNTFALYNKDYVPYTKDNLYLKLSDSLFICQPKKSGLKLTITPDQEVPVSLSYDQVTLVSDYCTVEPGTEVTYKIDGDYKLVNKTVTVTEDMTEHVALEPSVAEEVVLSGTFDSSSYSRDYMANATIEGVTVSDGALVCTTTSSYARSYGYIEFITPSTGGTLSITASVDTTGTTSDWAGAEIILSESLKDITYMNYVNGSASADHLLFTKVAVDSKTYTKELERHKTYYLCFGTGRYSNEPISTLSITNITFTAEEA
jgi:hypothetical protein